MYQLRNGMIAGRGALDAAAAGGGGAALTWNSADKDAGIALANSDRDITHCTAGGWRSARATGSKSSGKWYCEISIPTTGGDENPAVMVGIATSAFDMSNRLGTSEKSGGYLAGSGDQNVSASFTVVNTAGYSRVDPGNILGLAIDLDGGKMWFGRYSGSTMVWRNSGDPAAGTNVWVSWTPGGSWFIAGSAIVNTGATNLATMRLASTLVLAAPSGFTGWNG